MTVSYVSQQNPAPIHQPLHEVSGQKDDRTSTVSSTFNRRNVGAKDIGEFLALKEYTEVLELTRKMGHEAKEVRKGDWAIKKLETEFKKHDLPLNSTGHEGLKHNKDKAILNVMLGVQDEINNGKTSDPSKPPLAERFCSFIKDPASVYAGGRQVLLAEMNKAAKQAPETPHVSGDTVGADAVHKDAGMFERDVRPETVHQPYYDGKQPFSEPVSTASAPPPYAESQTTQTIQVERVNLQHIASRLGQCQQGEQENQGEIELYGSELVRINGVIQQLGSDGVKLPLEFHLLQADYARVQSQLDLYKLGKCEKELKELHSSLGGIDIEKENSGQIDDIESQLKALSSKVGSVGSTKENQALQIRIQVVEKEIGAWRAVATAIDTVENMRQEITDFQYRKSPESVESYSKRLVELTDLIGRLPAGKHRTDLFSQVSDLAKTFAGIQDEVRMQQVKDGFAGIQNKIAILPGCGDDHEKQRLLEKAETELKSVSSLLEQQKGGANSEHVETLRLLNEKVGELKRAVQATTAKMQSATQGQADNLVDNVNKLLKTAEARLSTSEMAEKAAPGSHNPRHIVEARTSLLQALDHIAKMAGTQLEAQRDRLQEEHTGLLSRLNKFPVQAINTGQSTAASTQPVSGNQNQAPVDEINAVLDVAEALVEALRSNPDSPLKDDRCAEARSSIEKATQMLGTFAGKDSKPERTALNTRLGNLNKQLNHIERGGPAQINAVEPNPDALLQKGVAAYGNQMQAFEEGGTVSQAGFQVAAGNMSALLSGFAPSGSSAPPSAGSFAGQTTSQTAQSRPNVPPQGVSHSPARQITNLHAEPPKTKAVLTSGTRLASFARAMEVTKTIMHNGDFSLATMGIKPSTDEIQSLVTSSDIPLQYLPEGMQRRMKQAYAGPGGSLDNVRLVQVYAFAPNEEVFQGASFQVELGSFMHQHHYNIYKKNSGDWKKYSPMGSDLRMPERLKQGARFYQVNWAMNTGLAQHDVGSFAHGPGDKKHSHLQDIGFSLVAPVLKALGADTQVATSHEAGFGIPFGLDLRRQPDDVLSELKTQNMLHSFGSFLQFDDDDLQTDGGGMANVVADVADCPRSRSSGINPVALQTVSAYQGSTSKRASEYISHNVGILWVQAITGLPGIKNEGDLHEWVKSNKPDLSELRLPQLL